MDCLMISGWLDVLRSTKLDGATATTIIHQGGPRGPNDGRVAALGDVAPGGVELLSLSL